MRKSISTNKTPRNDRGAALARAIEDRATALGISQKETSKRLGFSEPYYTLLLSGQRWFGSVEQDKLHKIAEFLDIPLVSVYMLAEIIHSDDFFRATSVESQVDAAFEVMEKDKRFAIALPTRREWEKTPLSVKLFCAILYQDVSGKDFLEKAKLIKVKDPQEKN